MPLVTEGDVIKLLLKRAKMTQDELAERLGTSRVTVSKLTKRGRLSEDWKLKLSEIFEVNKEVFTSKEVEDNSIDEEYTKIRKAELDAMQTLIKSMEKHIERLENQK